MKNYRWKLLHVVCERVYNIENANNYERERARKCEKEGIELVRARPFIIMFDIKAEKKGGST